MTTHFIVHDKADSVGVVVVEDVLAENDVTISGDGERVLFLRTKGGEDPVTCLWLLDLAAGGGEQLLADPAASWHVGSGDLVEADGCVMPGAAQLLPAGGAEVPRPQETRQ